MDRPDFTCIRIGCVTASCFERSHVSSQRRPQSVPYDLSALLSSYSRKGKNCGTPIGSPAEFLHWKNSQKFYRIKGTLPRRAARGWILAWPGSEESRQQRPVILYVLRVSVR
jgi:hypothetical protein